MSTENSQGDAQQNDDKRPVQDWESTMQPAAESEGAPADEFELDLEVEDIQTRLPYGSEDIADK